MKWFNALRMRSKLLTGFILVALTAAIVGGIGVNFIIKMKVADQKLYEKVTLPLGDLANISVAFQRVRINLRDAVTSTDEKELEAYLDNIKKLRETISLRSESFEKTIISEEAGKLFEEFKEARNAYGSNIDKIVQLKQANNTEAAQMLVEGDAKKAAFQEQELLDKLMESKEVQAKALSEENSSVAARAEKYMISFAIFGFMLAIGLGIFITRTILTQLGADPAEVVEIASQVASGNLAVEVDILGKKDNSLIFAMHTMVNNLRNLVTQTIDISSGIASASAQLHATAEQIATGSEEVAAQTSTVATASEEMTATSSDIARNCNLAADSSQGASTSAEKGGAVVQKTITGMHRIAEQVKSSAQTVERLGVRSEQIGEIVGTIEDIADQTNLLALNAAIEAARAGEQGRGFAVVADEVRALAERTTKATREIGEMIKAIQSETKAAVLAMEEGVSEVEKGAQSSEESGHALVEILASINEVTMQINQIATAAEQQTATTNEVTNNIQQVTEIIHQSARGAEETETAASQLAAQSQQLQDLVSNFRI